MLNTPGQLRMCESGNVTLKFTHYHESVLVVNDAVCPRVVPSHFSPSVVVVWLSLSSWIFWTPVPAPLYNCCIDLPQTWSEPRMSVETLIQLDVFISRPLLAVRSAVSCWRNGVPGTAFFFLLFFRNTMRSLVWISKTKSWFFNSFSRIVKPKTEGWKVDFFFLTNVKGRVCWENNEQRCCKCWITSSLTGGGNKILRPGISPKQWTHVELSKNHTWTDEDRRAGLTQEHLWAVT